jgi:hypothetical protein
MNPPRPPNIPRVAAKLASAEFSGNTEGLVLSRKGLLEVEPPERLIRSGGSRYRESSDHRLTTRVAEAHIVRAGRIANRAEAVSPR